jgi:hypothetical protein
LGQPRAVGEMTRPTPRQWIKGKWHNATTSLREFKRTAAFWMQMVYLFGLGVFVILYRADVIQPGPGFFGPLPFLVPWFGAVGAVILSLSAIFEHRTDWDKDDRYLYWSRPFIGAVTSTITVLIFQSGILAVGGTLPKNTETPTAKNVLYYVLAFIAGYRENTFRELIRRVADMILAPGQQAAPPVIASVTPPQLPNGAAASVTVGGSGFTGTTAVKLDNVSIPFVTDSDTQLSLSIPAMPKPTAPAQTTTMSLLITNGITSATVSFTIT